jgi:hypothetical protein
MSEIAIKTHQVLAGVNRRGGQASLWQVVADELLVDAELTQTRPLGAQQCQVNTPAASSAWRKCTAASTGAGVRKILGLLTRRRKPPSVRKAAR